MHVCIHMHEKIQMNYVENNRQMFSLFGLFLFASFCFLFKKLVQHVAVRDKCTKLKSNKNWGR